MGIFRNSSTSSWLVSSPLRALPARFASRPMPGPGRCIRMAGSISRKSKTTTKSREAETIQIRNWVTPAREVPMIFPSISWKGLTEEMMTSMMRVVFSSMTERITNPP